MKNREVLRQGVRQLTGAGIADAANDAWLLFNYAFDMDRTRYYMVCDDTADEYKLNKYNECLARRMDKEPVQYITGTAYFMGLEFEVNRNVLIPRFDTEILVENTLRYVNENSSVLDVCTGSGCIAISIARLGKAKSVTAADISEEALKTAHNNAVKNDINTINFIKSDMLDNIDENYDVIVSNPPYIRTMDINGLDREVRKWEPNLALDGHEDGLFFYHILAKEGMKHLNDGGILIMEIGYDQAEDVSSIMEQNKYADIQVIKDLAGLDRVVCGRRK